MKRYVVYLLAGVFVLGVTLFVFLSARERLIADHQARLQELIRTEQEKMRSAPVEPSEISLLLPGDTALVHACHKVFFVKADGGITTVKPGPTVPKDYTTITRATADEFEIGFSCNAIKNEFGIYPLVFTNTQGQDVTIYFSPLPDVNGAVHFYSHFEIQF